MIFDGFRIQRTTISISNLLFQILNKLQFWAPIKFEFNGHPEPPLKISIVSVNFNRRKEFIFNAVSKTIQNKSAQSQLSLEWPLSDFYSLPSMFSLIKSAVNFIFHFSLFCFRLHGWLNHKPVEIWQFMRLGVGFALSRKQIHWMRVWDKSKWEIFFCFFFPSFFYHQISDSRHIITKIC